MYLVILEVLVGKQLFTKHNIKISSHIDHQNYLSSRNAKYLLVMPSQI